jgi:chromate transporter
MPDSSPATAPVPATAAPPSLPVLFGSFLSVGLLGFGGVLPLARRMIVDQRRWLSAAEFTDTLSLCQFLPGANICNVAVTLGGRWHGPAGSVTALCGLLAAPIAVVISLGAVYLRWRGEPVVAHAFAGLSAAASGLVLSTGVRIASPIRNRPRAIAVTAATVAALVLLRLPLFVVLIVLVPISIALNRRQA